MYAALKMSTERKSHPVPNYRHLTSIVSWLPNIILRTESSVYSSSACCTCNLFVCTEIKVSIRISLKQKCTNPGSQFVTENKSCTVAPNICGSSIWNFLHFTDLGPIILRWIHDFGKINASQCLGIGA